MRDGVVFLLRDRVLRAITLAWVVLLLGAGFTLVAEVALAEELGAGAIGYGPDQCRMGSAAPRSDPSSRSATSGSGTRRAP